MLAQAEMPVVFVLNEPISSGARNGDGGKRDFKGPSTPKVPQKRDMQNMHG
jgi:hypothetical protein